PVYSQQTSDVLAAMLLPESALPAYEKDIDHRKLISEVNNRVLEQGREVFQQICHNCHGDINLPGSIPNSLRFAEDEFQHGNDPYTMYQTITRGWRLMAPQTQLAPREKYAVIHYIRSHFLEKYNRSQLFDITEDYLNRLPKGTSVGPDPVKYEPWKDMDYGSMLTACYEVVPLSNERHRWPEGEDTRGYVEPGSNFAYKGIAIRLDSGTGGVSQGNTWLIFEHDTLRVAGVWQGGEFVDWQGINFDHQHWFWPQTKGEILYETEDEPGWANPETGRFDDPRFLGLDGRRFGPLPRTWGHYRGLYRNGRRIVIAYTIGETTVLESHDLTQAGDILRILNIGKSDNELKLRLANAGTDLGVLGGTGVRLADEDGFLTATIPASSTPSKVAFIWGKGKSDLSSYNLDLSDLTKGGPAQWSQAIASPVIRGTQEGPFQWDSYAIPRDNPWKSWLRTTGIDFSPDGRTAYLCTWDGDIWKVDGIADESAPTVE
ncbi:MAG: c-type cytochrome, partial [Verrucomicrobiae bacterium]|nr:c-type cytochrome [Verrucomicrobiae bacterium]